MRRIERKDIWLLVMQLTVWGLVILLPSLAALLSTGDWQATWAMARTTFSHLRSPMILYFLNFYLLIPFLFHRRRYWLYALTNFVLFDGLNYWLFFMGSMTVGMTSENAINLYSGLFLYFLLNCAMIAVALAIHHLIRTQRIKQRLQEEKQRNTEAELAWLKNQINPHFLFNTLNNISSLAQIDGDETQEAIMQLSDLLRYAMYETNKPKVSLSGEVEFMKNYIELMKLRCNEMTTVSTQFAITEPLSEVAPLLFISLIENAFKHGMNSNAPARIDISLTQEDGKLIFTCDNTNNPKPTKDRSGSGIGLDNTRRRLDLLYGGRYTWEHDIIPENIYHVKITIRL
ncbi:MAG: sensor histidine kinase [Prevotella sp.]|nr:sensor histidine kinase [Prevotella sp.]